jgi:hypothetical protein
VTQEAPPDPIAALKRLCEEALPLVERGTQLNVTAAQHAFWLAERLLRRFLPLLLEFLEGERSRHHPCICDGSGRRGTHDYPEEGHHCNTCGVKWPCESWRAAEKTLEALR